MHVGGLDIILYFPVIWARFQVTWGIRWIG